MCTNKRKIVLVGTGMVGMSFAYSALNRALCDELVLVDVDKKRAQGEAMDLNHGIAFASARMRIYAGGYEDRAGGALRFWGRVFSGHQPGGHYDPGDLRALRL